MGLSTFGEVCTQRVHVPTCSGSPESALPETTSHHPYDLKPLRRREWAYRCPRTSSVLRKLGTPRLTPSSFVPGMKQKAAGDENGARLRGSKALYSEFLPHRSIGMNLAIVDPESIRHRSIDSCACRSQTNQLQVQALIDPLPVDHPALLGIAAHGSGRIPTAVAPTPAFGSAASRQR